MSMFRLIHPLAAAGGALALLLVLTPASFGQCQGGCSGSCSGSCSAPCSCAEHCNRWDCPPCYRYCQEGPPRIRVICGCPKPVCCPADAPNWGYFQTCWRPWPWGPDFSHCYGVPPAAQILPPFSGDIRTMPGALEPAPGEMPAPKGRPPL
jgi:hypothetical protein